MGKVISRRRFCEGALALGAAGLSSCTHHKSTGPESEFGRPNVLLIFVDDLNASLGCYGNSIVRTPNIDGLAARGVRFQRAYCQYPVCNPSRTSTLSGLRPARTGVMSNSSYVVSERNDPPMLPRFFKEQGYFSARVGKVFHDSRRMLEGKPMRSTDDPGGWDISEDEPSADEPDESAGTDEQKSEEEPARKIVKLDVDDAQTGDGFVARRVVQIMQEKLAKDRPFFLAAGLRKPHLPWVAPKKYFERYPPEKMQAPSAPPEHVHSLLPVAVNKSAEKEVTVQQAKEYIAAYYACVSFMDAQVGVILRGLEKLKLARNTLVIFLGDNGFHLGEHGLWGKSTLFDASLRTPLIVAGPGVNRGGACARTVELLDVYPTVVDCCGLAKVARLQGLSLRPLLEQPDATWDKPAYSTLRHDRVLGKSVRTERYRYTQWDGGKEGVELYDYQSDPGEWRNLAQEEGAKDALEQMKRLLK